MMRGKQFWPERVGYCVVVRSDICRRWGRVALATALGNSVKVTDLGGGGSLRANGKRPRPTTAGR